MGLQPMTGGLQGCSLRRLGLQPPAPRAAGTLTLTLTLSLTLTLTQALTLAAVLARAQEARVTTDVAEARRAHPNPRLDVPRILSPPYPRLDAPRILSTPLPSP